MERVKPEIDADFARSWDGVKMAAEMRRASKDESMADADRLYCLVEYYQHVVKNLDEVVESLGGGSVDASEVFAYIHSYIVGQSKN